MALTAADIFDMCAEVVQDTSEVTWTEAQKIRWINDARNEIVSLRPDAAAVTESVVTTAGTKQTLPANGESLIRVTRNMGNGGATPGRVILKADHDTLDENSPNWHADASAAESKNYIYDRLEDPTIYFLSPPADGLNQVEIVYCSVLVRIAVSTDPIGISDTYSPKLVDFILWRLFSRDAPESPNGQRAAVHKAAFDVSMRSNLLLDQQQAAKK